MVLIEVKIVKKILLVVLIVFRQKVKRKFNHNQANYLLIKSNLKL